MGFCWSNWNEEDFSFGISPKFQEQNVEWCRCTRVVLILLWSIYFFWVFGLLLYSVLVDAPEMSEVTSFKSSSNQSGWQEYDDRADGPNPSIIVGGGLVFLFNGALIWKRYCGDRNIQVSDLLRKEMPYDQGVGNKISFKDGASDARKYQSLRSKSFISSTTMVHLVSFITYQNALELVLVAGSLSNCYNLTSGLIRKTMDRYIKRIEISKFFVSSKCYECNISSNYVMFSDAYVYVFSWAKFLKVRGCFTLCILLKLEMDVRIHLTNCSQVMGAIHSAFI